MQAKQRSTFIARLGLFWHLLLSWSQAASISDPASTAKISQLPRPHEFTPRIVGGRREVDPTVIMWQALFLERGSVLCGGTLISHSKIVTAAHCDIKEMNDDFVVRIGGQTNKDGMKFPIVKTYRHENFTRGSYNNPINDLMVVEFHNPMKKLGVWAPSLNNHTNFPQENAILTASGYGRLGINDSLPGHLRSVNVPVVSHKKCSVSYSNLRKDKNICAGNEMFDSCKGDSGGPLWTRSKTNGSEIILIAVVSYGYGCAAPNAPGVYTRVSGYADWVEEVKNFPETEYVVPRTPRWQVFVIIGTAVAVATVLAVLVVFCCLPRNKRTTQGNGGAGES